MNKSKTSLKTLDLITGSREVTMMLIFCIAEGNPVKVIADKYDLPRSQVSLFARTWSVMRPCMVERLALDKSMDSSHDECDMRFLIMAEILGLETEEHSKPMNARSEGRHLRVSGSYLV